MKLLLCRMLQKKALALLFVLAPFLQAISAESKTIQATTDVVYWSFSETTGPVINTQSPLNQSDSAADSTYNGWVGYSPDNDDGEVDRDGSHARFNGQRNSIVFIANASHADLNPGNESFIVTAHFAVDQSVLSDEALGRNQTWNLVQKGRFNNLGGQWKLQIRKNHSGRIFLQCLFNDNQPDTPKESIQIPLNKTWIRGDHMLKGRCTLDRSANQLSVDLTNTTKDINVARKKTELRNNFGSVVPQLGECGTPNAFGGNVTIGNKPLCPKQQLDTDDAFRGKVYSVRIQRF